MTALDLNLWISLCITCRELSRAPACRMPYNPQSVAIQGQVACCSIPKPAPRLKAAAW